MTHKESKLTRSFFYCALFLLYCLVAPSKQDAASPDPVELVIGFAGDTNLNPNLTDCHPSDFGYPWGNVLPILRNTIDLFFINHESTFADTADISPRNTKFEDPVDWEDSFSVAGVSYISLANNHQFDFGVEGLYSTLAHLKAKNLVFGGIGTETSVKEPLILEKKGIKVAVFAVVAQSCWGGRCTCGMKPENIQCRVPNDGVPGLWFIRNITDETIADTQSVIKTWKLNYGNTVNFTIAIVHCGGEYTWLPAEQTPEKRLFLRALVDAGIDLVLTSGPVNIQPLEYHNGKPMVNSPGQFLFRHYPGVDNVCDTAFFPCVAYRPELGFLYSISISFVPGKEPVVELIQVYPTRHGHFQVNLAGLEDAHWMKTMYNQLASVSYGSKMVEVEGGEFVIVPEKDKLSDKYFIKHKPILIPAGVSEECDETIGQYYDKP